MTGLLGTRIVGAMIVTPATRLAIVALICASAPAAAIAQTSVQGERVATAFVLALGRTPTPAEAAEWAKGDPRPVADLLGRHREALRQDAAAGRAVAVRAGLDAFGRAPTDGELQRLSEGELYAEIVLRHIGTLAGSKEEYARVVHRAYQLHLRRDAYGVELDYWRARPALSFVLLAGCVENWARRNQPGLMATAGVPSVSVNSAYLVTVRLSPAVAAEARAAAGLARPGEAALAAALGRHIVAPGASSVASDGGIHFAAAGAADLMPAPPGRPPVTSSGSSRP